MSAGLSAAGKFAVKAELAGWTVDRQRRAGWRSVQASHGSESFTFEWTVNESTGNYVFAKGTHSTCVGTVTHEPWTNLAAALRIMRDPGHLVMVGGELHRLPFDPDAVAPDELLAAVNGKTVVWRNRITGAAEEARVPRDGKQTHITYDKALPVAGKILNFADPGGGFRSVRLSSIVEVK